MPTSPWRLKLQRLGHYIVLPKCLIHTESFDVCIKGLILENEHHKIANDADWRPQYYAITGRLNTWMVQDMPFAVRSCHSSLWPTVTTLERPQKDHSRPGGATVCCHHWPQTPTLLMLLAFWSVYYNIFAIFQRCLSWPYSGTVSCDWWSQHLRGLSEALVARGLRSLLWLTSTAVKNP